MTGELQNRIKESLKATEDLYSRLVLLVGEAGSGKTDILQNVAGELNTSVVNVNLELSSRLLELTAKQRPLRLPKILEQVVDQTQLPIMLDNIEILFDKNLKQDPLKLLQGISRNRPVVAAWNGVVTRGVLVYAAPGHPEYRRYESADALVVNVNRASKDTSTQEGS